MFLLYSPQKIIVRVITNYIKIKFGVMKKFYLGKISIVDTEFGCFLIKLNEIKVNELNYENKCLNIIIQI